jgi:hypothetical protein
MPSSATLVNIRMRKSEGKRSKKLQQTMQSTWAAFDKRRTAIDELLRKLPYFEWPIDRIVMRRRTMLG